LRTAARSDFKVLDYGCGAGEVVGIMRRNELDAHVCELFYQGGDLSEQVPADIQDRIFAMHGDRIPFPDESFDLVISNQVLEHVPDLDVVLAEMRRVLKPGGICLSVFPHREVWREGHCNIPFLHRFARGSKPRIYYAATLRSLGLGYFKKDMTSMQWSRNFCDWLDRWCYYRPRRQIEQTFARHLSRPRYIEADWLVSRKAVFRFAPAWFRTR
jgi:SAM-dependent methyltransferase